MCAIYTAYTSHACDMLVRVLCILPDPRKFRKIKTGEEDSVKIHVNRNRCAKIKNNIYTYLIHVYNIDVSYIAEIEYFDKFSTKNRGQYKLNISNLDIVETRTNSDTQE